MQSVDEFLSRVEERRVQTGSAIPASHRAKFGQFFTPRDTAAFLAKMAPITTEPWRVLDPGAGIGSLAAAAVARWLVETDIPSMTLTAYEVDSRLLPPLISTLEEARQLAERLGRRLQLDIREVNFILDPPPRGESNLVLMNPPYGKLRARSPERAALAEMDHPVRVPNLYAAFLVRAVRALSPEGRLVAITPRSFANGPYFQDLRTDLMTRCSFQQIHVFGSRDRLFADANVLQENIVFSMCVNAAPTTVTLSSSDDAKGAITVRKCDHDTVVHPEDSHRFIRLALDAGAVAIAEQMSSMPATLSDLGLKVSTGRVVDFRSREHLRRRAGHATVPLVYPQNLRGDMIAWPVAGRKPQALLRTTGTEGLLLPNSHYVVVKRLSAKEENRRVVAALSSPEAFGCAEAVAFENHLNVFHADGQGLDPQLAAGLTAYLNSDLVDEFIRQFNGHTQINATDLRELRYPTREDLIEMGNKQSLSRSAGEDAQAVLDELTAIHSPVVAS